MRSRISTSTRPSDVPPTWTVYNAPRPLYGHKTWRGDFLTGIFYAAIDPDNPDQIQVQELTTLNIRLDAVQVVYRTEEELFQKSLAYYRSNFENTPDLEEKLNDPENRSWIVRNEITRLENGDFSR